MISSHSARHSAQIAARVLRVIPAETMARPGARVRSLPQKLHRIVVSCSATGFSQASSV